AAFLDAVEDDVAAGQQPDDSADHVLGGARDLAVGDRALAQDHRHQRVAGDLARTGLDVVPAGPAGPAAHPRLGAGQLAAGRGERGPARLLHHVSQLVGHEPAVVGDLPGPQPDVAAIGERAGADARGGAAVVGTVVQPYVAEAQAEAHL